MEFITLFELCGCILCATSSPCNEMQLPVQRGSKICNPLRLSKDEVLNGESLNGEDFVVRQYESLPYPRVSENALLSEEQHYKHEDGPIREVSPPYTFENMNHYFHQGKETFRNYFRIIIAGGGTGGITIFVGEQMNNTNGEIVHLDFSIASIKIAQRRARARKLKNIIWIRSWIEASTYLGMGMFETLQCSGVLHHLKNPFFGLNILKEILTTNAGIALMVYAKYGRTSVYQLQDLMKIIILNQHDIDIQLHYTNYVLGVLPKHNWLISNPVFDDHKRSDIDRYDLFLHKRDISFSANKILEWIKSAGLHFVELDFYKERVLLKIRYIFVRNMSRKISLSEKSTQMQIAEILHGKVLKHSFYASKLEHSEADFRDSSNILYIHGNPRGLKEALQNKRNYKVLENQTYFISKMSFLYLVGEPDWRSLEGQLPEYFQFPSNAFSYFIVNKLLDSNKGMLINRVYDDYRNLFNSNMSINAFFTLAENFYDSVKDTGMFLLKSKYCTVFSKTSHVSIFRIKSI